MKIAVQCNSPLLQKSLEMFLREHITTLKQCDLVLRDKKIIDGKNSLFISSSKDADLIKPFSKSQLLLKIEEHLANRKSKQLIHEEIKGELKLTEGKSFKSLEKKIETLTRNYQHKLLKVIREHYE